MAQAACQGYLAYVLLTAHVLLSGTDTGSLPVRLLIIASLLVVVGLAASEVVDGQPLFDGFAAFQELWDASAEPPTISVLVVAGLANPQFLIEISAIAVT